MLHFYRQLQPIKVITFDLDDTLYDNYFVIRAAEQAFLDCLQQLAAIDITDWQHYKQQLLQQDPIRYEDVIVWRQTAAAQLLKAQGLKDADIQNIIQQSMQLFVEWRHKIDVPPKNRQFLTELAKHYPLVAISNGNVYPPKIGLDQFQLILRGGEHGRAKPHPDLFQQNDAIFCQTIFIFAKFDVCGEFRFAQLTSNCCYDHSGAILITDIILHDQNWTYSALFTTNNRTKIGIIYISPIYFHYSPFK